MVTVRWAEGVSWDPSFACHDSVFRWAHSVGGAECAHRQLEVSGTPCGSQELRWTAPMRRSAEMNVLSRIWVLSDLEQAPPLPYREGGLVEMANVKFTL